MEQCADPSVDGADDTVIIIIIMTHDSLAGDAQFGVVYVHRDVIGHVLQGGYDGLFVLHVCREEAHAQEFGGVLRARAEVRFVGLGPAFGRVGEARAQGLESASAGEEGGQEREARARDNGAPME
jgi:hypothetical protein